MTIPVLNQHLPDSDLWRLVCQGDANAFEVLVGRYQSLVAAVAYNVCGNVALSEDVAQETFWAAWRERASLLQPDRLRPWLCGIARNLGKNACGKAMRVAGPAATLDLNAAAELATDEPGPVEDAVTREEESLVWETLEQIPDAYREPLILFYREDQSVAEVAATLELSEEAVRQRLSRGRGMLRDRVAELVESGLRRTRPGQGFTVVVMAGLTAHSAGTKAAVAGTAAATAGVTKGAAGVGLASGILGGLLGSLIGLGGGWLGSWLPAQVARTKVERDLLLQSGRRLVLISIVFAAGVFGLVETLSRKSPAAYLIALGVWYVLFMAYVAFESIRTVRKVKRVLAEPGVVHELNDTALSVGVNAIAARFRGRVFRSRTRFLGYPLVDINVNDPRPPNGPSDPRAEGRVARGWIAIGDDARGLLLAIGSKARGFIAIGHRAVGVVSLGGVAVGLVAGGGLALGVVGVGGLGLGLFAVGGAAIGWQACGGAAIAWDVANGGAAIAWHAAIGGVAIAHDYALGGQAWAKHANDMAAKALLLNHPLMQGMKWYSANVGGVTAAIVVLSLVITIGVQPLMYRRDRGN